MRIVLPNNFREVSLFIPTIVGLIIVLKNSNKFSRIKVYYLNSVLLFFLLFMFFISFQLFNNLHLPGFLGGGQGNTGFLLRWSLINNFIAFTVIFIGFKIEMIVYLISKLNLFYVTVFIIAMLMLLLNINSLPLFNTFTWTVIVESANSKKMIIAGAASLMLLIYQLAFGKKTVFWLIGLTILLFGVAVSGSRIAFLSYLLIVLFGFLIYHRFLIRGLFLMMFISVLLFAALLSPLVLLVPAKYQRLVVIFPSEFYSGALAKLRSSAAAKSSDFRYEMWGKAVIKIKENPWSGTGIGIPKAQYDLGAEGLSAFQKIDSKILIEDFMNSGSLHNTYVSIAYIFGLPATIFFIVFLFSLLLKIYKLAQSKDVELKTFYYYFTLILIFFIIQSFISDIHNSIEFYAFAAIITKVVLLGPKIGAIKQNQISM
jgi:O-antigen ligase